MVHDKIEFPCLCGFTKGETIIVLLLVAVFLMVAIAYTYRIHIVMGQVEIHQSTTVNGQSESITQDNGKTVLKTDHGTITVNGNHLKYCAKKCNSYILEDNGTIIK